MSDDFGARGCPLCYSGERHEHTPPTIPEQPGMLRDLALVKRIEMLEGHLADLALENRRWREKLPDLEDLRALRDEARMPDTVIAIRETMIPARGAARVTFRDYSTYELRWMVLSGDDKKALRICAFFIGGDNILTHAPTMDDGMSLDEFCQTVWRCKWTVRGMIDVTLSVRNVSNLDSRIWGCAAGRLTP